MIFSFIAYVINSIFVLQFLLIYMKKIHMVDLKGQYQHIKTQIDRSILDVIDSGAYINGPEVHALQKELEDYLEVKHVIPCANGTDALQVAMMSLGLQSGDEVITVDFTFAATVEVIALLQLKPVLIDVDIATFNMDIEALKKAITPKTKAIVPVHLFGQCANMDAIMEVAQQHNLYVIEDTAQAIGAEYTFSDGIVKKAGTIGHFGSTSFFPSKNLGCYGDGGAIFTNDDDLAQIARGIVNHGMYKRYYHDVVGVNSRLDSIQATILRAKLPHLDAYNKARQKAANFYDQALMGFDKIITPLRDSKKTTHVFHQYTLRIVNGGDRDGLHQFLLDHGIPNAIYYPVSLHAQKAYASDHYNEADFKITNQLIQEVISLPMHTELDEEQLNFITKKIVEFLG